MREWLDVHRELMELARQAGLVPDLRNLPSPGTDRRLVGRGAGGEGVRLHPSPAHRVKQGRTDRQQYDKVHRAILTGLLSSLAHRGDGYEYTVAGGGKANLWPGSGIFQQKPKWLVAAEVVETTRRYLRICGQIDARWIEPIAGHLVKRSYHGVHWAPAHASAMALERITLFGLTIVAGRRIHYGPIDPAMSRHLDDRTRLCRGPYRTQAGVPRAQRGVAGGVGAASGEAPPPRFAGRRVCAIRVLRPPCAGRRL